VSETSSKGATYAEVEEGKQIRHGQWLLCKQLCNRKGRPYCRPES